MTADEVAVDRRRFHWTGWFWIAIVAGLIALDTIQVRSGPTRLRGVWDGTLTATLAVALLVWFVYVIRVARWRRSQRLSEAIRREPWRGYTLIAVGIALTVALVLLHHQYADLVFAAIGVTAFAVDGWIGLFPAIALGALFVYAMPRPSSPTELGGDALSIAATLAVVYSLAAVIRQRAERDRLIADLRRANEQLKTAHQELEEARARDVELGALRERSRLAREMHDSLGHALVLISVKIEAAQRLQAVAPERAQAEWENTKALVRSTMSDLRAFLSGLNSPALQEQPFASALHELALEFGNRTGLEVVTSIDQHANDLDGALRQAIYRVAQEALTNVAKHAQARHVCLSLSLNPDCIELEVADDGVGFGEVPARSGHFGIAGMRERVEGLGGTLHVSADAAGGTHLRASLPVRAPARV